MSHPGPCTAASRRDLLVQVRHLLHAPASSAAEPAGAAGPVAALHLDLSGFGALNTSLGHDAGDRLLGEVLEDLRAALRQGDLLARGSGDEFHVVSLTGVSGAVALARRLLEAVGRPREVDGHRVTLGACVGVAVSTDGAAGAPGAATTPEDLLGRADTALGEAKRGGPGTVQLFRAGRTEGSAERLELLADLAAAPTDGSLRLHYQPIVELGTGREVRREALLRWEHDGRLRSPDHFLPAAEAHGLMRAIGTWVLNQACHDAARWQAHGDPCGVTVNVGAAQVTADLPGQVAAALRVSGLAPGRLSVEVTETGLLVDVEVAGAVLDALAERGVHILLDDFGTGYSSLSHLARLPVTGIKLDRSFVAGLPGAREHAVVAAVAQIGAGLGLATVAEGVETTAQRELLLELGYTHGQGWLFGRPVPVTDLRERAGCAGAVAPPVPAPPAPRPAPPVPTSGQLLDTLVADSQDAILTKSLEGTVWSWNPAAERLYGWSAAEVLGRSIHLVVPPGRESEEDRILAAVARGERVERHDTERVTKDGRTVLVSLSVSPLRDAAGAVVGAAAIAHDVTAERLAAAELERRRREEQSRGQLLTNLVQHSHDAILTKSVDGTVWSWNPAAERLYGWSAREMVGQRVHLIAPPRRHSEIDEILAELRAGRTVERHDTERVTKDGRTVLVNLSVSPLLDGDGTVIGAAAVAHDVTAERLAAAELEHAAARQAATAHLRELGDLAGTVAHDVSNSLGAILMTTAALRRSLPWETAGAVLAGGPAAGPTLPTVGALLDQLEDVTETAGELVGALRRYARQDPPRVDPCRVDAVVADLVPVLTRLAGPGRHLRCLTTVGPAAVGVSRAELSTVLINLVTNAVHAVEGEGTITVSTELVVAAHPALRPPARFAAAGAATGSTAGPATGSTAGAVAVAEPGAVRPGIAPTVRRLVRLRVADTGCGMDEQVRHRAFQPLFSTRHRSAGGSGSGLGLASVHRIATSAGGSASITSSPGRGTTVELLLPVVGDDPAT